MKDFSLPIFIPDYNLFSCELDISLIFKVLYWVILYYFNVKENKKKYKTLTVPCEKSKMVVFSPLLWYCCVSCSI